MSKCLVCESENWFNYCSIEDGKYNVMICKDCSFTELSPKPTEKELNEFYSGLYRDKYSNQNEVDNEVVAYEQLRADRVVGVIKKYFKESYTNILDVGCSSGTLLKNIGKLSAKPILYGIEMNDNYRNFIVKNKIAQVENITNDDINTYFEGRKNKFDFISIVHVLEHLSDPKKALESIYQLLNGGGIMYIEVPNLKTPYNNLRKQYFAIYHLYYFTETTLRNLLKKVGFEIMEEQQIAGTSICFVCKKGVSKDTIVNKNDEFNILIHTLKKYESNYPFMYMKQIIIKLLIAMGIKDHVKKILGK
jgi:2-polyprenyl-3-methyl-5-hydroxy-6-metoxy-1,4-benzoquinol methylase